VAYFFLLGEEAGESCCIALQVEVLSGEGQVEVPHAEASEVELPGHTHPGQAVVLVRKPPCHLEEEGPVAQDDYTPP